MELTNLQIHFHGKDHLEHRITYVNENGTQCRETLCSGVGFAQHVINCLEAEPALRTERDDALKHLEGLVIADTDGNTLDWGLPEAVEVLRREREKAVRSLESAGFTDNGGQLWKPPIGTPPPYISQEIRYVLHGDIQPCTVLYSDDTTTLLRLDEGDIMCETDTIEWSDSVTYRCQELLRDARVDARANRVNLDAAKIMAQLVRDERIVLNDDGDVLPAVQHTPKQEG